VSAYSNHLLPNLTSLPFWQVLNEPKHNIKGGDISVQAAAPKNDRFGGGGSLGGYGAYGGYGGYDRGRGGFGFGRFGAQGVGRRA
jgi:hypothetical protein